mmetsp:Transcript_52173/g.135314  ORF Transcript_52173/g.135314 Transcript_52173/m.135314 type:complete len:298 (-) Transcript_52173:163-1056(-)
MVGNAPYIQIMQAAESSCEVRGCARWTHAGMLRRAHTIGEHNPLCLEPMDALVTRVEYVLVPAGAAHGPKLAIDEPDEVRDRDAGVDECVGELAEVRRPRRERARVDQVREGVVDVLDLPHEHSTVGQLRLMHGKGSRQQRTVNQTASEMAEIERPVSHVIERSGSVLLYLRSSRSTASSPVKRCPPSVSNSSGSCKACTTSGSQSSRKPNVTYVVTDASSTFRPRPTASRCSLSKLSRSGPMSCSSRRCSGSAAASSSVSATSSSLESPSSSASMTWKRRRLSAISAEVYGLVGMA